MQYGTRTWLEMTVKKEEEEEEEDIVRNIKAMKLLLRRVTEAHLSVDRASKTERYLGQWHWGLFLLLCVQWFYGWRIACRTCPRFRSTRLLHK